MRDLVDNHRAAITTAAEERDKAFSAATQTFHDAADAYRLAMQKATEEYNQAVTASEVGLHAEMRVRSNAFFGEVPVKGPTIRITAPMPNVADAPAITAVRVDGQTAGAEGGQP